MLNVEMTNLYPAMDSFTRSSFLVDPKSQSLSDGEIYLNLRECQLKHNGQNGQNEAVWWTRLVEGRRKDIRRLQRNASLLRAFDLILPWKGMWRSLTCSQIERMLALKCPEVHICSRTEIAIELEANL